MDIHSNRVLRETLVGLLLAGVFVAAARSSRRPIPPLESEPYKRKGAETAPVSLVIFSDFECPYCRLISKSAKNLLAGFPNQIQIVLKHFPLRGHRYAKAAAEASECAADQGKFWEYHDMLFARQREWSTIKPKIPGRYDETIDTFVRYADSLGLDKDAFKVCLDSGRNRAKVEANRSEGRRYLVDATPTCILNKTEIVTTLKEDELRAIVQDKIREVSSGERS